jgi:hypothetical protein
MRVFVFQAFWIDNGLDLAVQILFELTGDRRIISRFAKMKNNGSAKEGNHEAFWPTDLFEKGIGWVVAARSRSGGRRIETGVFLLDVFCLGVKRAIYDDYWTPETYQTHIVDHYFDLFPMELVAPCCARKLVEDAVHYASGLGFAPHADFKKACRVLGGIRSKDCPKNFVFGQNGKPFYISGPNDTEAQSRRIVEQLARRCSPGKFEYIASVNPSPELDRLFGD